jgi:hypothetical protein
LTHRFDEMKFFQSIKWLHATWIILGSKNKVLSIQNQIMNRKQLINLSHKVDICTSKTELMVPLHLSIDIYLCPLFTQQHYFCQARPTITQSNGRTNFVNARIFVAAAVKSDADSALFSAARCTFATNWGNHNREPTQKKRSAPLVSVWYIEDKKNWRVSESVALINNKQGRMPSEGGAQGCD